MVKFDTKHEIFGFIISDDFGNTCYSCNQFNPQGQGFMAHPNTTMCCLYLECWKIKDITAINQMERNCPPGTWFDPEHGPNGIPCIAHKPYDHCVAECLPEHVTYGKIQTSSIA